MRITFIIACLFFCSFADYIELRDGISASTEILDTSGCNVTFRRSGNIIKMSKDKISFIVCKSDTVFYNEFICTPEIEKKASNKTFEAGYNTEKVNAILRNFKFDSTIIRNCLIYCCTSPLNGNEFQCCWGDKFNLFKKEFRPF